MSECCPQELLRSRDCQYKKSVSCLLEAAKTDSSLATRNIGSASSGRCLIKDLPAEILDNFLYRLDNISKASLSITCRGFSNYLSSARKDLDQCSRWRFICYLERDLMYNNRSVPDRLACAYCKTTRPKKFFKGDGTGMYLSMIDCPDPSRRFCRLHIDSRIIFDHGILARFYKSKGFENTGKREWELSMTSVCGHCGYFVREDSYSTTCPKCRLAGVNCHTCKSYPSLHYWRLGLLNSQADKDGFQSRDFHLTTGRAPFTEQRLYVKDSSTKGRRIEPLRMHRFSTINPLKFDLPAGLADTMTKQIDMVVQKPWKTKTPFFSRGLNLIRHLRKTPNDAIAVGRQRINFLACCYKTMNNKDGVLDRSKWIEADVYPERAKKPQGGG